ncbi:Spo0B domain-containing protein [Fictibacillus aquaticus]|uniref:Spo0B domain-containing protein n=1 Tax=Fictibacillus aquaticus TaxID=2021314 RepID=UPI0035ED3F6D
MADKWTPVELLRHARHDWLNQVQLIKANLSMNRPERVKEIIEASREEARLSNLKMPKFAEFLLLFNWNNNALRIKYSVESEQADLSEKDDILFHAASYIAEAIVPHLSGFDEPVLTISLDPEAMQTEFIFHGGLSGHDALSDKVKSYFLAHKSLKVIETYTKEKEFYTCISF